MELRFKDCRRLLGAMEIAGSARCLEEFPAVALKALEFLISAESFVYNRIDLVKGTLETVARPNSESVTGYAEAFAAHMREHPVLIHYIRSGDESVHNLLEFTTPTAFRSTGLYGECYRHLGYEDHAGCTIASLPGALLGMAAGRKKRFSRTELVLMEALRLHLSRIHEALRREEECRDLLCLAHGKKAGLLWLDEDYRIEKMLNCDGGMLSRLTACRLAEGSPLPARFVCELGLDDSRVRQVSCSRAGVVLKAVRSSATGRWLMTVREAPDAMPFRDGIPGLTSRESEVLGWASEGKTNPEIATILGVSANTVKNQMASILDKLGTETRGAAVRSAFDLLSG